MIETAVWDSERFGWHAGKIPDPAVAPTTAELARFDHVLARLPVSKIELLRKYQTLGFAFVTVDYTLERPVESGRPDSDVRVGRIARSSPNFGVQGFQIEGSRFSLDPAVRRRMPERFWDRMIIDHCEGFADFCLYILGQNNDLQGFASCFERSNWIEVFLLAVHPLATGQGIGGKLLHAAALAATATGKPLVTNVVAQNIGAMRFYFRAGYLPVNAETVLHYTREAA